MARGERSVVRVFANGASRQIGPADRTSGKACIHGDHCPKPRPLMSRAEEFPPARPRFFSGARETDAPAKGATEGDGQRYAMMVNHPVSALEEAAKCFDR
ncbi:hypothetical protein MRX96_005272 [Rhipicephalus microplus]